MLAAVRALAPRIRAAAPRTAAARRLPTDIFAELADIGVFKALLAPHLGGRGATLSKLAPVVEELARADGSAGWLAYVGSEAMRQVSRLSEPVAREIVAGPNAFIAGMFSPGQTRAVAEGNGYRVSGRWHTCSGSLHSTWIMGGSTVYDGDEPRLGPAGRPLSRLNFIPTSQVEVLDTWDVGGLQGTNSNDVAADGVFVPEEFGAYDVPPPDFGLYPMVPLGIARAAMDEFVHLAGLRGPTRAGGLLHRDLPAVQREVAAAEAALRAARAYMLAEIAALEDRAPMPSQRDVFLMAASHAAQTSVQVVDTMHRAAGSAAIFGASHLLRCLMDVRVAVAHVSLQPINLESAGRALLDPRSD